MTKPVQKPTAKNAQIIQAERHEPTFFAMIPKMAIMDLDPYELALYCNYKQTVGENGSTRVTKTNATIAHETRMSVNRMKAARDTLIKKRYIDMEIHKDIDGSINQPPTITVRDIWSINHQIYSVSLCEGVSNGDTPPPPFVTPPLSRGDTKEEPNKNNQKEEEKTPPPQKPAGKPREPNPMYDAVKDVFQLTGAMNTDMQKLLQGKATKKGYVEYNLDEPMDAPELRAWGEWYRKTELKGDHALNMVRKPEKIQSSIGYWREQKRERAAKLAAAEAHQNAYLNGVKTQTSTASSHIQNPSAPPDDQTPMTPEQRAQAEALFANVVANLGGKQRVSA